MPTRRVLVTGLSTPWGGRLAQALERDPEIETVIGIDRTPPKLALERTEFVQVADSHSLIRRIVDAAEIDTVVDTRLVVGSRITTARRAHENNVIGTMNVLAAAGGAGSPVRKLVFRSSAHLYGAERDDPAFFTEAMRRPHEPRTPIERDIVEAEDQVGEFRARNPETTVTVLRFADGLGPELRGGLASYLALPALPAILGFDPRLQVLHADDIAGALAHAVHHDLDGVFNCAADGVLVLSEIAALLGKTIVPVLPPWGTGAVAAGLRRVGLQLPPELLGLLRYGRGLDNRRLKATGWRPRSTTRETVLELSERQRLASVLRPGDGDGYRYEAAVEEFLRFSPSVGRANLPPSEAPANRAPGAPRRPDTLDGLTVPELLTVLPSLPAGDLRVLRDHERGGPARDEVLAAIDRLLGPAPAR